MGIPCVPFPTSGGWHLANTGPFPVFGGAPVSGENIPI
ncbi:hypothetical protein ppKF707_1121 [Metapseudomonas furukawaii]|uniref:Uncharacterized protein n=1 Tax=Metapseudomonas furukawaii TaxID=1149133 RepID=A0AAD1FHT1_METFU|nr:hypothetical protein ppKF707_1121 [Pseudomonas furukawaii]BAU76679.1 hypothetical protein KF707C_49910 [Pseudomonas furukawaii]